MFPFSACMSQFLSSAVMTHPKCFNAASVLSAYHHSNSLLEGILNIAFLAAPFAVSRTSQRVSALSALSLSYVLINLTCLVLSLVPVSLYASLRRTFSPINNRLTLSEHSLQTGWLFSMSSSSHLSKNWVTIVTKDLGNCPLIFLHACIVHGLLISSVTCSLTHFVVSHCSSLNWRG